MMPQYYPLGDSAITVILGDGISRALSRRVLRAAEAVTAANNELEVVPAYASFAVFFDPLHTTHSSIVNQLQPIVESVAAEIPGADEIAARTIRIPVRYDGEDLPDVAARVGLATTDVIGLHAEREYHVYIIGSVPGFAYLGDLDPKLVLPRRPVPRKRVPAGAVAIAETQTGIYPFSTPGGWHLVGSTDLIMFDPMAVPPGLLRSGDRVIFDQVK